jgi:hypothetical protein
VVTAADMNAITADAQTAQVLTSQTTTSTGYTDLATVGPSVTMTLVAGQVCLVIMSARVKHSAAGGQSSLFSYAVSGATTQAASDNDSGESADTSTGGATVTRAAVFVALASGSHTFTMKYQVQAGGTGTFYNRRLIVKKF